MMLNIEMIQRISLYIKYLAPQYRLCKTIEECEEAMSQITKIYQHDEKQEIVTNITQKAKELSETTTMSYQGALEQVCKELIGGN